MSTATKQLYLEVLGLPQKTRAKLAEKLLASLEDDEPSQAVDRAWNREALRRYRAYKAEKSKARPHSEVMRDAYEMLKKR
jgi:putative addiction module component (TIGR02574 family)